MFTDLIPEGQVHSHLRLMYVCMYVFMYVYVCVCMYEHGCVHMYIYLRVMA